MPGWFYEVALVGSGGFLGSVLRYALSGAVHRLLPFVAFPYGTLFVNVTGCLLIGLLGGMSASRMVLGPSLRLFLFLGILGGFTTFSTFGYETLALFRDGEALRGVMNVVLSLLLCLASVWLGWSIGEIQLR